MFDSTRLPVSVYRSTDEGAPRLGGAGSLKTLLKACLVTGYGGKAGLGWAMPFEDAHSAVFQSQDPQSNRHFLKIDNAAADYANAYCYQNMTALNSGTGYFGYGDSYRHLPYRRDQRWLLAGHARAFTLVWQVWDGEQSGMMFFGDFPSLAAADGGNTVWMHNVYQQGYSGYRGLDFFHNNGNGFKAARRWDGIDAPAEGVLHSLAAINAGLPYPDPIGGGLLAGEIYLYEKHGSRHLLRGLLPGWLKVQHDLSLLPEEAELSLPDTDDHLLKFNLNNDGGSSFLLNVSAWEA